ncbi:hypothetical protein ACGFX8_31990 [Streptomyces sp. NPDC048362]|uniref:hypothetical protein n=1 Tax=Streptomyces sp. NPDC048362 TaxID=3365539 RepID=UPI0037207AE0
MLTIDVTLLLAIIVFFRLRRRTESRSRFDEKMTVVIVLALGRVSGRDQGAVRVSSLIQIIEARRWRPAR